MKYTLTGDEYEFVRECAEGREALNKHNLVLDPRRSSVDVLRFGIGAELAAATMLGMQYNPYPHRGGDGLKGDLWDNTINVTIDCKARHLGATPIFAYPPWQTPSAFEDDYGILLYGTEDARTFSLGVYFNQDDWNTHHEVTFNGRIGLHIKHMRPISELVTILDDMRNNVKGMLRNAYTDREESCELGKSDNSKRVKSQQSPEGGFALAERCPELARLCLDDPGTTVSGLKMMLGD